jgi:hypothetical protein
MVRTKDSDLRRGSGRIRRISRTRAGAAAQGGRVMSGMAILSQLTLTHYGWQFWLLQGTIALLSARYLIGTTTTSGFPLPPVCRSMLIVLLYIFAVTRSGL